MANRITIKDLEAIINRLNVATKSPDKPWEGGKANIGNYHLYQAYGAYQLHRMVNTSGGVRLVLGVCGKRELHALIDAYLRGYLEGATQSIRETLN